MPSCCIKDCKSRTYKSDSNGITFFRFPKDVSNRKQWLDAIENEHDNFNADLARICSNHFDSNHFVMTFTKPRSKNTPAKELRRLKKDAIPCKMLRLNAEEKRKEVSQKKKSIGSNKHIKVNNVLTVIGIPTYTQLVQYAKEKQHLSNVKTVPKIETETVRSVEKGAAQSQEVIIEDMETETVRNMETGAAQSQEEMDAYLGCTTWRNKEVSRNNISKKNINDTTLKL
ncbi:uncharacterized protein [Linepithema humile]|uniref:uncharacterized protein n=1 Tax=Linepithema humile TaxID=83485 RepID=UPI00351ED548